MDSTAQSASNLNSLMSFSGQVSTVLVSIVACTNTSDVNYIDSIFLSVDGSELVITALKFRTKSVGICNGVNDTSL